MSAEPLHHVLAFGPYGIAVCTRCGTLMTDKEWAYDSHCYPRCAHCGRVREPVHVCPLIKEIRHV